VWQVDDARHIPEPAEDPFDRLTYFSNAYAFNRMADLVDPPRRGPALDINALDELPNSTWFKNSIGLRSVSPSEAANGGNTNGPPSLPLTIFAAKTGGANPGFFAKDSRGIRYLVKFDNIANPEQQTGGHAVVNRIFWTLGYHVTSDHVFFFRRDELVISEKMKASLSESDVDNMLTKAAKAPDRRVRALASEFVPGPPKGGWTNDGRRPDDPNDTIDHENRRALRALQVFSAWLGHTDLKQDNSIDAYVTEGENSFLRHYLVDFGEALGGHQSEQEQLSIGWEYGLDWQAQGLGLVSLGLYVRPWEDQKQTPWKSIGAFGAEHFEPERWRERYHYEPFHFMDNADAYWATKTMMKIDRPILEAIVRKGHFSQPEAAAYLVDTLLARQKKVGAAYLDLATPLDEFTIRGRRLCATDLTQKYGFARSGEVERLGENNEVTGRLGIQNNRVCLPLPGAAGEYQVLRVRVARGNSVTPAMQIHYKGGAAPRLLGIVREPKPPAPLCHMGACSPP